MLLDAHLELAFIENLSKSNAKLEGLDLNAFSPIGISKIVNLSIEPGFGWCIADKKFPEQTDDKIIENNYLNSLSSWKRQIRQKKHFEIFVSVMHFITFTEIFSFKTNFCLYRPGLLTLVGAIPPKRVFEKFGAKYAKRLIIIGSLPE